tara:strand:- start:159 stop:500 length:342 start_codon:yes stop_codon:yes gene_type:complete
MIDKITILQIKTDHLQGKFLENVQKELSALQQSLDALDVLANPAPKGSQSISGIQKTIFGIKSDRKALVKPSSVLLGKSISRTIVEQLSKRDRHHLWICAGGREGIQGLLITF